MPGSKIPGWKELKIFGGGSPTWPSPLRGNAFIFKSSLCLLCPEFILISCSVGSFHLEAPVSHYSGIRSYSPFMLLIFICSVLWIPFFGLSVVVAALSLFSSCSWGSLKLLPLPFLWLPCSSCLAILGSCLKVEDLKSGLETEHTGQKAVFNVCLRPFTLVP